MEKKGINNNIVGIVVVIIKPRISFQCLFKVLMSNPPVATKVVIRKATPYQPALTNALNSVEPGALAAGTDANNI